MTNLQIPVTLVCTSLRCGCIVVAETRDDLINNTVSRNRYIIMRHGYSARNPNNILVGRYPEKVKYPLLEKGIRDAEESAKKLVSENIDVIISSPLVRASQTADIVSQAVKVLVEIDERLCDYNVGIFEGKRDEEMRDLPEYSSIANLFEYPPPAGETYTELRNRLMAIFKECEQEYRGKTIVLVSHGDPLWLIDSSIRGLTIAETVESRNTGDYIPTGTFQEIKYTEFPYNERGELDFGEQYLNQCVFLCKRCGEAEMTATLTK